MLESYFFKLKYFSTKPLFLDSTLYTTETVHAVVSSNKELSRVPVEVVNESFECAVIDGRKLSDQELVPLQLHLGVHATYKIQSHIWCMLSIKCFYFSNLFSKFFHHRTTQDISILQQKLDTSIWKTGDWLKRKINHQIFTTPPTLLNLDLNLH